MALINMEMNTLSTQTKTTVEHYKLIAYIGGEKKNYFGEFTKAYLNSVGGLFKSPLDALVHKIKEILPISLTMVIYDNFADIPPMPEEFENRIHPNKWASDHQTILKIVKRKVIINKLPVNEKYSWIPKAGETVK